MKIVVYGPERRVGALVGTDVIDLGAAAGTPADLEQFILQGGQAIEASQRAIEQVEGGNRQHVVAGAQLRAPLAHRGVKICMAGANYADHAYDTAKRMNPDIKMEQVLEQARQRGIAGFWKLSEFVVDPEAGVTYPTKSKWLDYEG